MVKILYYNNKLTLCFQGPYYWVLKGSGALLYGPWKPRVR